MAVDERISEIIDLPELQKQYDKSVKLIGDLVGTIADANKKAKINVDILSNAKNLEDLAKGSRGAAEANQMVVSAMGQLKTAAEKTSAVMGVLNGHTGEYFTNLKKLEQATTQEAKTATEAARQKTEASKQATEAKKQEAAATTSSSKATLDEAKAATEAARQKEIETKYTIALTREKERLEAAAERAAKKLRDEQTAYGQLNKEYKEAATLAQELGARKVLLERELGTKTAGTYGFQTVYTQLTNLHPELKKAQENAMRLHKSLLEIDQTVGRSQRNVGNYNGAVMAMSQILREAPSFAYSFSTGLLAVSNNIPILVDEINKLKVANDAAVAAGGKAIPIWKTLFSAFASPAGIITTLTAVVTIFAARMSMVHDNTQRSADAIKHFEDNVKSLQKTLENLTLAVNTGFDTEATKLQTLIDAYNSANITLQGKLNIYKQLQSLYPNVLSDLTDEEKRTMQLNAMHEKQFETLNKVIAAKVHISELDKTINAEIAVRDEAKGILSEMESKLSDASKRSIGRAIIAQGNARTHPQIDDAAEGVDVSAVNKYLDFRDKVRQAEQAIASFRQIQLGYTVQMANLEQNRDKQKKTKPENTIAGINEELAARQRRDRAIADLQKQQFEQEATTNKAIADDESKTLDQRLDAYSKYQQNLLMIAAIDASLEQALVRDKLNALQEKEEQFRAGKIKLNKYQQKALLLDEQAAFIELQAAQERHNTKNAQIAAKGAVDIAAIRKSELEQAKREQKEWLNEVELGLQERIELTENSYSQEAAVLSQKYLDGKVSYQRYLKDMRKLQNEHEIVKLEAAIANDRILLMQDDLTAEQRIQIQKRLNKELEQLTGAKAKNQPSENPILKSLGLSDEDFRGMQQVADGIVNLNAEIVNVIQQRYQVELDALDAKQQKIEDTAQLEIDAVNKSMLSETEKEKKIAQIKAQAAAQEKQIEQEKNEIRRKQAIAEKEAAIASIIEKTAIAIISAYNPVTPASPFIAAAVGAIGAAQLATVIARPIPEYAEGTEDHPGGPAVVGEAGQRELIEEPGKAPYWSNATATVYNLPKHTRVIPEDQLLAAGNSFLTPQLLAMIGFQQPQADNSRLESVLKDEMSATRKAIANKQETHWHLGSSGFTKVVKNGNSWTTLINKDFN